VTAAEATPDDPELELQRVEHALEVARREREELRQDDPTPSDEGQLTRLAEELDILIETLADRRDELRRRLGRR
jgi:hypothetical protein